MEKKINERGIMSACEYSLVALNGMKSRLINAQPDEREMVWAIMGLSVTLVSKLISIIVEVLHNAGESDNPSARDDLDDIQRMFNEFFDGMRNHE